MLTLEELQAAQRKQGDKPVKEKYHRAAKEDRTWEGVVYDSKKEMTRHQELLLLEKAGGITNLKYHPDKFEMNLYDYAGKLVEKVIYEADFTYYVNGIFVVEDVKGFRTKDYKRKKRLMKHFGIDILET